MIGVFLLAMGWLSFYYTEVGMASEIGVETQEDHLSGYDYSAMPSSVLDDANELAREVIGEGRKKFQGFVNQLLATYAGAVDKDVVIIFNSGGWGWKSVEETPGWSGIIEGIKSKLDGWGQESLVLNYRRTGNGVRSCVKEFIEVAACYPSKSGELSRRVEFLTDHIPNLKVIVAGESNGTVIVDKTMDILKDNPRVFSIQTGTPFWHKSTALNRTLLLNSNGETLDTFSCGNIAVMLWVSFKSWVGLSSLEDNPGTVLSWLRAPGHDYSWQYPVVYSEIVNFLEKNFKTGK